MKSTYAQRILLVLWCCLLGLCANIFYPTIRFTSLVANAVTFFVLMLVVFAVMLWSVIVLIAHYKIRWKRAIIGGVAIPLLIVCLFGLLVGLGGLFWTNNNELEPIAHVEVDHSMIVAYLTNGGATQDYGVSVRRERLLMPGVLYVHDLANAYPARYAELRVLGDRQVEIVIPPYGSNHGQTIRVEP